MAGLNDAGSGIPDPEQDDGGDDATDAQTSRFAHLAEGNARQARKRVAADLLIRDPGGRVLVVDPTYKEGWDLPGGMIEANESPHLGSRRELLEELQLAVEPGRPLVIEWVPAHGPWDDQIVFVFDGGTLTDAQIDSITIGDDEIAAWRFVDHRDPGVPLRKHIRRRLELAAEAMISGATRYIERNLRPEV